METDGLPGLPEGFVWEAPGVVKACQAQTMEEMEGLPPYLLLGAEGNEVRLWLDPSFVQPDGEVRFPLPGLLHWEPGGTWYVTPSEEYVTHHILIDIGHEHIARLSLLPVPAELLVYLHPLTPDRWGVRAEGAVFSIPRDAVAEVRWLRDEHPRKAKLLLSPQGEVEEFTLSK